MKKLLSFFIILCMLTCAMSFNVSAAYTAFTKTQALTDDFETLTSENYPNGATKAEIGTYGTNFGLVDFDTTEAVNNALYLQSTSASVSYNLGSGMGTIYDTGNFKISMDLYPYDKTVRVLYIRVNSSTAIPVIRFDTAGKINWLNEGSTTGTKTGLADYEPYNWVKLTLYYNVDANKCSVYIDDEHKGSFTLDSLTSFRTIKFTQEYNAPNTDNPDRVSMIAIDNMYAGFEVLPEIYSNVATGATDIDVDKEFKVYADYEIDTVTTSLKDSGGTEISGAFNTPVITGNSARIDLVNNLTANTSYTLDLATTYKTLPATSTKTIAFTTGDGAQRTTTVDINFDSINLEAESDYASLTAAHGNVVAVNGSENITDFNYDNHFDVYNTNSVNGNALKITTDSSQTVPTYDLNAYLPDTVTDTKVVIEFDRLDTSSYHRGPFKVLSGDVTSYLYEFAATNIKVFENATNSNSGMLSSRPNRPALNTISEYKLVVDVNKDGTSTHSLYINGVLQSVAANISTNTTKDVRCFTAQLWSNANHTANDYVMYDNIKVSYVDVMPSLSVKVGGENALTDETVLAANDVVSVAVSDLIYSDARLIYALYSNNSLVDIISGDANSTWTAPSDIQDAAKDYKLKIMLWKNFDNIAPLTKVIPIN